MPLRAAFMATVLFAVAPWIVSVVTVFIAYIVSNPIENVYKEKDAIQKSLAVERKGGTAASSFSVVHIIPCLVLFLHVCCSAHPSFMLSIALPGISPIVIFSPLGPAKGSSVLAVALGVAFCLLLR